MDSIFNTCSYSYLDAIRITSHFESPGCPLSDLESGSPSTSTLTPITTKEEENPNSTLHPKEKDDVQKLLATGSNAKLPILDFFNCTSFYIDKSFSCVKNMSDFKRLNSTLDTELSLRFYPFIETIQFKMTGDNGLEYMIEKKNWHDPSSQEGRILGNNILFRLFSLDKDFFFLTQKKDICTDDLLKFQKENDKLSSHEVFGVHFLGEISTQMGSNTAATPVTLSCLNLARLILFRYKKIISYMMLIDKALKLPMKWIDYKRLAIATLYECHIDSGIASVSFGNALPSDFWTELTYLAQWMMNYKEKNIYKPDEIGVGSEKKKTFKEKAVPPSPKK